MDASPPSISGGYRIVLPMPVKDGMNAALLPPTCVTQSDCLTSFAPDTWAIQWTTDDASARKAIAAKFGFSDHSLERFQDWATAKVDTDALGWPGTFYRLGDALDAYARWLSASDGIVCGLGLAPQDTAAFIEESEPVEGDGMPGIAAAIRRGDSLSTGGQRLGFDVLGWDIGGFHSYICNGLETEFHAQLGVTPNRYGLYDTLETARRCADFARLDSTGAEPCLWQAWEVRRYEPPPEGGRTAEEAPTPV